MSEYATDSERNQILIDAINVKPGETTYKNKCPRCHQSGSFGVTREDDSILYYCHRASCGIRGRVFSTLYDMNKPSTNIIPFRGGNVVAKSKKIEFYPNPFKGEITELPKEVKKELADKYELHNVDIEANNIQYEPDGGRIVLPIYDFYGRNIGKCLKKVSSSSWAGRKVVNYYEIDDEIGLHFPPKLVEDEKVIVVTEGILDAIKVSCIFASAALMGSDMSRKQAYFLASHFDKLLIALDPDAIGKAREMLSKYRAMFSDVRVKYLSADPKDMDYDELERILTI